MLRDRLRQIAGEALAKVPYSLRYGRTYFAASRLLSASERWTQREAVEFQYLSTRHVLESAERHSAWYAKKFAEFGVSSRDFQSLDDIRRFPMLTKEELRDHTASIARADCQQSKAEYITTGGSTGLPVGFYQSRDVLDVERAFFRFQWAPYGIKPGDLSVVLRGAYVGSSEQPIRYFPRANEWHLSIYQMSKETLPKYVRWIREIRPVFIQAYPSAITPVARFMAELNHQAFPSLKAVMCGSENLYPNQFETITRALKVPVHSWYGQAEKVCMAVAEPGVPGLAMLPQYGLSEILDSDGNEVVADGGSGEIVATSYWNDIVPFVRYRTGDIGIVSTTKEGSIYRYSKRLSRVDGRIQEFLVTGSGRMISMTAMNMHDDVFDGLECFRFFQDTPGQVELHVVPLSTLGESQRRRIKAKLKNKLGEDCAIEIKTFKSLDRTVSGKFRFIEQHLDIDNYLGTGDASSCVES